MTKIVLKVGDKGEVYTTKEIRKILGIKEGGKVIAYILRNMLIITPIPSIEEKIEHTVIKLTPVDAEKISEEAQTEEGIYE